MQGGHAYTYLYETSVQTTVGRLTISEFGSFGWHNGRWAFSNYTGRPFTTEDFASWYSCPDGVLVPGEVFRDPENWSGAERPKAGKMRWYYIGIDAAGKRYKGEAVVELQAESD